MKKEDPRSIPRLILELEDVRFYEYEEGFRVQTKHKSFTGESYWADDSLEGSLLYRDIKTSQIYKILKFLSRKCCCAKV